MASDILLSQWTAILAEAAGVAQAMLPAAEFHTTGTDLIITAAPLSVWVSLDIDPRNHDRLVPSIKIGGSGSLPRDPAMALAVIDEQRSVIITALKLPAIMSRRRLGWPDRVWARDCPCGHCSGKGTSMGKPCKNCNGSGVLNDPKE